MRCQRRPRRDAGPSRSEGNLRFPEETGRAPDARLADPARPRRGARRRSTPGSSRRRCSSSDDGGESFALVRGPVGPPPSAALAAGRRRAVPAHRPARSRATRTACGSPSPPAGVYRTDDGGRAGRPRNDGVRAEFLPDKYPEFGQCVHKVARDRRPARPPVPPEPLGPLPQRRRRRPWKDVANGVPSDFGFPMAAHPARPRHRVHRARWTPTQFRCTPEGQAARVPDPATRGNSWAAADRGPARRRTPG